MDSIKKFIASHIKGDKGAKQLSQVLPLNLTVLSTVPPAEEVQRWKKENSYLHNMTEDQAKGIRDMAGGKYRRRSRSCKGGVY